MALSDILRLYEIEDLSVPLTRVMSFSKFKDLIDSETLYFAPASKFDDKLEGNYTNLDHQKSEEQLISWSFDDVALKVASDAKKLVIRHNQQVVVISCWTMATEISDRMWDTYTFSEDSLAIQTTVGKLRKALGTDFLFIPVKYLDFNKDAIPRNDSLEPFFYKQKSYYWEKELRIVAEVESGARIGTPRKAPVSLSSIISAIKFHPRASKEFIKNVHILVKRIEIKGSANLINEFD